RHIIRQIDWRRAAFRVQAADAQQLSRPDYRVELDVILADEVINLGRWVVPPLLPVFRLADVARPFHTGSQVAHHRLEPDVQALGFPARHRHRYAPVDVAGDRSANQAANLVTRDGKYVGPPVFSIRAQVRLKLRHKRLEIEEIMLGLADHRLAAV